MLHALCLCSCALILLPAAPLNAASRSRADQELEAQLRRHIEVLASDDLQGREPGTEGEAKTLRYIARQWYDIGLVSGTNDPGNEWFAPVTMVAREPADSVAQFARKGRRAIYMPAKVLVLTSGRRSLVRDAPMLFVGYARGGRTIRAPNWRAGWRSCWTATMPTARTAPARTRCWRRVPRRC
ncbi:hypothetical protein ACFSTD_08305 [Novosphingobium colocasiae]